MSKNEFIIENIIETEVLNALKTKNILPTRLVESVVEFAVQGQGSIFDWDDYKLSPKDGIVAIKDSILSIVSLIVPEIEEDAKNGAFISTDEYRETFGKEYDGSIFNYAIILDQRKVA